MYKINEQTQRDKRLKRFLTKTRGSILQVDFSCSIRAQLALCFILKCLPRSPTTDRLTSGFISVTIDYRTRLNHLHPLLVCSVSTVRLLALPFCGFTFVTFHGFVLVFVPERNSTTCLLFTVCCNFGMTGISVIGGFLEAVEMWLLKPDRITQFFQIMERPF